MRSNRKSEARTSKSETNSKDRRTKDRNPSARRQRRFCRGAATLDTRESNSPTRCVRRVSRATKARNPKHEIRTLDKRPEKSHAQAQSPQRGPWPQPKQKKRKTEKRQGPPAMPGAAPFVRRRKESSRRATKSIVSSAKRNAGWRPISGSAVRHARAPITSGIFRWYTSHVKLSGISGIQDT